MVDLHDGLIAELDPERPVLIAGATASGKSALALRIAERQGGAVINADALQVFADWRVLTARPTPEDEARADHRLYGHVPGDVGYSVGEWLRDLRKILDEPLRPIIVGGTGLYLSALTEGLADIPATHPEVRRVADRRLSAEGHEALLAELDPETAARIDSRNPMRVQRAWEVQASTGRGLAAWHSLTARPLLPYSEVQALVLDAEREWLVNRIAARFRRMLETGLLDEARANRPGWTPARPSAKAIGATELMLHIDGKIDLEGLEAQVVTLTRQYAKRQRTWFRNRMKAWTRVPCH